MKKIEKIEIKITLGDDAGDNFTTLTFEQVAEHGCEVDMAWVLHVLKNVTMEVKNGDKG